MIYFTIIGLVCYAIWVWRTKTRDNIIHKSNMIMEAHNLFIRKMSSGVDYSYFICRESGGSTYYQLRKTVAPKYGVYQYKNHEFTNDKYLDECYTSCSEMSLRELIILLWSTVVDTETFTDIKPPSKNTPKVDNLISQLVQAEMDGDKEKVELIFNQYLNDK